MDPPTSWDSLRKQTLEFFTQMAMAKGVSLDPITLISTVVYTCAQMFNLKVERSVHGYMIRGGIGKWLIFVECFVKFVRKDRLRAAKLFEKREEEDVISWGSMITCYAHHGGVEEALDLFNEMVARGIKPNVVVLISALQACEATCDLEEGKRINKLAVREGLDLDINLVSLKLELFELVELIYVMRMLILLVIICSVLEARTL